MQLIILEEKVSAPQIPLVPFHPVLRGQMVSMSECVQH